MAFELLYRVLVLGAIYSGVWALVSSGFTLVFGVGRILNFSHGIFFVLGAYLTITLKNLIGFVWLAMLIAVLLVGLLGVFIQKAMIDNLEEMEMIIIVTLAFALFIDRVIIKIYGHWPQSLPSLFPGSITFGGVEVGWMSIFVLFSAFCILGVLHLFINRTQTGAAIEATAQDEEIAMLVGVNVKNVLALTMALSAMLAALAGIFYTQLYTTSPEIGITVLLFAFSIVILGGLGSVKGSIVGAFVVGYVTTVMIQWQGIRYAYIVTLLVIVATLLVRPSGLFGKEERI
ncbi:hypothetical protein AKJ66_02550 [candidate division MSBL1 archaeon SCGC-AAA259E22]|uniref:Branched-chain amino acid ABC transporter permease n=1 Tax=candidate division MSBL1 archaeon SCGC-AAA259E22 TaxID=1698265 RepID=A0A133UG73_9EURY|nr:hypothetical protein AKJ66_02550 [candidate division MSBL1 archaeon SCGC-AAA259E22]